MAGRQDLAAKLPPCTIAGACGLQRGASHAHKPPSTTADLGVSCAVQFEVNALGPLRVVQVLRHNLAAAAKVCAQTSAILCECAAEMLAAIVFQKAAPAACSISPGCSMSLWSG